MQVGSTFTSLNCSEIQECQVITGKPTMITKQRMFCHEKAKCVNLEGKAQCHCNNGFTGDGIDQCIPETFPSKLRLKLVQRLSNAISDFNR